MIQLVVIFEETILLVSQIKLTCLINTTYNSWYCRGWHKGGRSPLPLFAALIFVLIREWLHLKISMLSLFPISEFFCCNHSAYQLTEANDHAFSFISASFSS